MKLPSPYVIPGIPREEKVELTNQEKFDLITQAVCIRHGIALKDIFRKTKTPTISIPRQEAMYIMREKGSFKWVMNNRNRPFYPQGRPNRIIADYFGLAENTAYLSIRIVEGLMEVDAGARERIASIIKNLSF